MICPYLLDLSCKACTGLSPLHMVSLLSLGLGWCMLVSDVSLLPQVPLHIWTKSPTYSSYHAALQMFPMLPCPPIPHSSQLQRKDDIILSWQKMHTMDTTAWRRVQNPAVFYYQVATEITTAWIRTWWQFKSGQGGEVEYVLTCTVVKSELIATLTGAVSFTLTRACLTTAKIAITLNAGFPWRPLNVFFWIKYGKVMIW